ncbi:hypothetical protein BDV93DRAFT_611803 [Ceratobasidium sp. AG-I]|nr:hypothetical protein BDV93DRAFT_611803 [Ceratobasidium sp. AG-I]
MESQAAELRSELATLQKEVKLLRAERDVARLLNEYVYVHDAALSPTTPSSPELDQQFDAFFTNDGEVNIFGIYSTRQGKAAWIRSVMNSQGNILGAQMVTSNMHVQISQYGFTAEAKTSAVTTMACAEGTRTEAGQYTYKLRNEKGEWKIASLRWLGSSQPDS